MDTGATVDAKNAGFELAYRAIADARSEGAPDGRAAAETCLRSLDAGEWEWGSLAPGVVPVAVAAARSVLLYYRAG